MTKPQTAKPTAERNAWTLAEWCKLKGISLTKGYELARAGQLDLRKLGNKPIVTAEADRRFEESLPKWQPSAPTNHRRATMRKLNKRRAAERAALREAAAEPQPDAAA